MHALWIISNMSTIIFQTQYAEEDGEGGDSRRCLVEEPIKNPGGSWAVVDELPPFWRKSSRMASFVTEVLASSGKLEKEDLAGKISKMSRKVEDIKVNT